MISKPSLFPVSFNQYKTNIIKPKFRRLAIASQGGDNTGKTEFILSMPGPGLGVCVDNGDEGCLANPEPPETRRDDFMMLPYILLRNQGATNQEEYKTCWKDYRTFVYDLIKNPDALSLAVDGGSESYELIKLAVHGRVERVPQMSYSESDAQYKNFMNKIYAAGKNFILTHKMKAEYVDKLDPFGKPVLKDGVPEKVKSGEYTRQGHRDHEYLFHVQIEHLFRPAADGVFKVGPNKGKTFHTEMDWGIKILRCKMSRGVEGQELWGSDCSFQGLVKLIYPNVPLSEWGY